MSLTGRYFRVKDGSVAGGPYERDALRHPTVSISAKTTDKELAAIGVLPEDRVGYEYTSATQNRTGPVYEVQATKVVATYTVTDKTAQELENEKMAAATSAANAREFKTIKLLFASAYQLKKEASGGTLSVADFLAWLGDDVPSNFPDDKFIDIIKPLVTD